MNKISRENLFEYYNKIFTLKVFREEMVSRKIKRKTICAAAMNLLGRSIMDDGAFNNISNLKSDISAKSYADRLFSECNLGITSGKEDYVVTYYGTKYVISVDECQKLNDAAKDILAKGIVNVFDEDIAKDFNKIKALGERLKQADDRLWLIVMTIALYNTYVLSCVQKGERLIESLIKDDKVYYTSAVLLGSVKMENTGLSKENDFWERIKNWEAILPEKITPKQFNAIQKIKLAWQIGYMLQEESIKPKENQLSDNDIVKILLNVKSSFLKDIGSENLKRYRELAENYGSAGPILNIVYGIK